MQVPLVVFEGLFKIFSECCDSTIFLVFLYFGMISYELLETSAGDDIKSGKYYKI